MKVLLLNPSIKPEQFGRFASLLEAMPCVGLAYVATFLSKAGHDVRVFDDFALGAGRERVLEAIESFQPEVLGVSVLTPVATDIMSLLTTLKRRSPETKVMLGNIHADLFPETFAGMADAIVHGEGEQASVDLLSEWSQGKTGEGIPGVSVFVNGSLSRGPDRPLETDLDSFPFPDWGLMPYQRYSLLPLGTVAKPIVAIAASRGCPYRCTFCALENQGKIYRKRSVKNVVDEIEYDVEQFGVKQVGFMDPIFPLGDKYAIEFSKEMISRGLHEKVVWLSELRTDSVTIEGLRWMKKAGCRRLVFGIESGVDSLLKSSGKANTAGKSAEIISACREIGITTVGLFMLGMPSETPEETQATIEFACKLELDFAKFAITVPFPGSELYDSMVKSGELDRTDWENYTTFNPDTEQIVIASRVQSPKQLLDALKDATTRFYMRPKVIARQLFTIRTVDARQMANGLWSILPDLGRKRA
jgi:radical SAM superfamily enzyme YgiQ (UPF0313 family)